MTLFRTNSHHLRHRLARTVKVEKYREDIARFGPFTSQYKSLVDGAFPPPTTRPSQTRYTDGENSSHAGNHEDTK